MARLFDRLRNGILPARQPAAPFKEQGVAGFVVHAGMVQQNETNYQLTGRERWKTAADLLANVSIIAAGLRYSLNLTARPKWKLDPVSDKAEAKAAAEFAQDVIENTDRSWSRIVRTAAMYRYHGFGINEWVASKRDDGKIGIQTVEARPQHTIERWDLDDNGGVKGVWQLDPILHKEIYLPRAKIVYLVDDMFTDRPDGLGLFRHLVEPAHALKVLLKLERIGFQRDLVGIPIGRVPLGEANALVAAGKITAQQRDDMIEGIRDFVSLETKTDTTGLLLDSEPYVAKTDTGSTVSSVMKWGVDLITGEQNSVEALGAAIKRLDYEMALIMGVSSLLTGREGEGSRALSEDQSRNLYLTVNQSLKDMAEAFDRDIIGPLWAMNGMDDKLRPKLTTEDAAFKDVEEIAATLAKMAQAGAILAPDDPAINDLRNLMGISEAEEMSIEDLALIRGAGKTPPGEEGGKPGGGKPANSNEPKDAPRGARERRGAAQKYDPDQPRVPAGSSTGGQWTDGSVLFEIAPNPDNKELLVRWNALSDAEKRAITDKLAGEFAPQILEALGVEGKVEDALGGFEGQVNPSLVLSVSERPFEVAGAIGDAFSQKAMVVMSDQPGEGLNPVGIVSVVATGADVAQLRKMQDGIGDLADGWTYHNGRMQLLNFSGMDNKAFAEEVDRRLGGAYMVEHATVYSSYIEEKDYARPGGSGKAGSWGQVRSHVREAFSQRLEEELGGKTRKGLILWPVDKFDPNQPRDPKGTPTGGQWTSASGAIPWSAEIKAKIHADNRGKSIDQMREEATENQRALHELGREIEDELDIEFDPPPPGFEVKTKDSIIRKINDEGYEGPHQITDMSRASFVVDGPDEADAVIRALRERGEVYDKGWTKINKWGYVDRKVYLQHPNGGTSEVQITPRGIYQLKMGMGHRLYEIGRKAATPKPVVESVMRKSRTMYNKTIRRTDTWVARLRMVSV